MDVNPEAMPRGACMTTYTAGVLSGELASTIRPHSPSHGKMFRREICTAECLSFCSFQTILFPVFDPEPCVMSGSLIHCNTRSLLFLPHIHFIVSDFSPNSTEPKRCFLSHSLVPPTLVLPLSRNHTYNKYSESAIIVRAELFQTCCTPLNPYVELVTFTAQYPSRPAKPDY